MKHKNGQYICRSWKFRILLHKCIKVICKISVGIRQHRRGLPVTSDSEYLWKHHQSQVCLFEAWGGKCSNNYIHKRQVLRHYKFLISLAMFFTLSFQNSLCNIPTVFFPGLYCGIHTEPRYDMWNSGSSFKLPRLCLFLLFPPSWFQFQPIPWENILFLIPNENCC